MTNKILYPISILLTVILTCCKPVDTVIIQTTDYPSFGSEFEVIINGLSFDAMEPFISLNGDFLFFNNLNDGINTKLFYATKVNDSVFNFEGELNGTNQSISPHLDAVPDMDVDGNFYWTSTRNYPGELNNLFSGNFNDGNVDHIGRVYGNFYKGIPGWLVMDHAISSNGKYLYANNARFDDENCQGPCETTLDIAKKVNDSSFILLPNSDSLLKNISDDNYIYYAPCISNDDLELYFTRYLKGQISPETMFEICVAVRSNSSSEFSSPKVLFSDNIGSLIEAPALTSDKSIMYYHRKTNDSHKIMMRYRN